MKSSFNIKHILFIMITALLAVSCLEEYTPEIVENDENILVVEGNIGDIVTSIQLSRTTNLGENALVGESNAKVILEDESQSFQKELTEKSGGLYEDSVILELSKKYRIRIITSGDQEFVSETLSILKTPVIDSVGWDAATYGLQIHVSTHDDTGDTQYYYWSYEETYVYTSRYYSYFFYEDEEMQYRDSEDQIYTCWKTNSGTDINVGSTIQLTENVIYKQPVTLIVPSDNVKLARKYSIKVTQRAISKDYYEFWELLKQNSEELGTLFDPQPSQLTTNFTSVNSEDDKILGFIGASTLEEERKFIQRSDLPYEDIPYYYNSFCTLDTILNNPDSLAEAFKGGVNIPTTEINNGGIVTHYVGSSPSCVDCTTYGGTTEEPDFWDED